MYVPGQYLLHLKKKLILNFVEKSAFLMEKLFNQRKKTIKLLSLWFIWLQDKRLIIILSNCNHTMVRVIPRLVENLNKHGYVEMEKALRVGDEISYSCHCFY